MLRSFRPTPIVIWEPETPAEKEELQKAVIKDNEVELQRAQAQQGRLRRRGLRSITNSSY